MEKKPMETKVNVTSENDEIKIISLSGEAPRQLNPQPIKIQGSIEAPGEYFVKRFEKQQIDENLAHVEVEADNGRIVLFTDPASEIGVTVVGQLQINPLLKRMDINSYGLNKFSEDNFIILLKETRSLFSNQSDCLSLVDKIKNLDVKVQQTIDKRDDERANRKLLFEQTAESDLIPGFELETNIFVASKDMLTDHTFYVELKFHYANGEMFFWLESADLQQIVDTVRTEMIGNEILHFTDHIPVIYR